MALEKVIYCFVFLCIFTGDGQYNLQDIDYPVQNGQTFASYFSGCRRNTPEFDNCIRDALNNVRPFFKTGVPEYNIPPFDPFTADEVVQILGGPNFNYKLKLTNIMETGWTIMKVTKVRSHFEKNFFQYSQFFPEKYLQGDYEFVGNLLGNKIALKGHWNLTCYDVVGTTTVTWKPSQSFRVTTANTPVKTGADVHKIGKLDLHISNLLGGRTIVLENILDQVINTVWEPGFLVLRPLVNDLLSTFIADVYNRAFVNFPFNEIIR